ncbi:MAG TPA: NAD(P)H-binding protein [Mucilaginibacter sp.]|nr:NAD(P)H-binding protein [Mucilaginibacter sp.]
MKVLLAGVNSYIGKRMIGFLAEKGHHVVCLVRDKQLFCKQNELSRNVTVISGDLLRMQTVESFPQDIDAAYYLINTLTQTSEFAGLEALSARHFIDRINSTACRQIITLTGIQHHSSPNILSRQHVEDILGSGRAALTVFRTTMIIGDGSIATELLKTVTGKTPVIVAQSWTKARVQPIWVNDVLSYLEACLLNEKTYNRKFDIGGPEVLSFKQMLLYYIAVNIKQKPGIIAVPMLTSKMSSYLLNILTPVSYTMAKGIIETLQEDNICRDNSIAAILPREGTNFKRSLRLLHDGPAPIFN